MQLVNTPGQRQERRLQLQTMQIQRFHILQQLDRRIQTAIDNHNLGLADLLVTERSAVMEIYLFHQNLINIPTGCQSMV